MRILSPNELESVLEQEFDYIIAIVNEERFVYGKYRNRDEWIQFAPGKPIGGGRNFTTYKLSPGVD